MNYVPEIYFGSSLDYLTAQSLLKFMDSNQMRNMHYVRNNLHFEGVNWKRIIDNSIRAHKQSQKKEEPVVSEFGKSLLQICIDSEETVPYHVNRTSS